MRSLSILAVLTLFLYITLSESCNSPTAYLLGKRFRFQSKNFPKRYFRHRGYQMWLDPYSTHGLYQLDSSFDIVPGLAGVGVSFRSVNFPNYFIRHSGYKCYIHRSDGKPLFRNDATFIPRVGLADRRGVSFESVNFPGYFIRHRGYRVQINRIDGSQLFRLDATWFPRQLKGFSARSQWLLVDGDHYSRRHITFDKMEGLEIGKRYSTSYGVNTENSWKDAIERDNFAGIGCSIKTMFMRLKSARVTGDSSWTKLSKRGTTYISVVKPTFVWQLYLYGLTSEGTLIVSKTNIYGVTTSNHPPRPYMSSQSDTTLSDEKFRATKDDVNDKDTGSEKSEKNIAQLETDTNDEPDTFMNDKGTGSEKSEKNIAKLETDTNDEPDTLMNDIDTGSEKSEENIGQLETTDANSEQGQLGDEYQGDQEQ